jgi:hypothetical protein
MMRVMSWNFISWMEQNLVAYATCVVLRGVLSQYLFILNEMKHLLSLTVYLKIPYSTTACCCVAAARGQRQEAAMKRR